MTTNKGDKVAKVLLAAAGIGVSAFLIVKYHKQIFNKFSRAKNSLLYDFAKIQRSRFDVHIVNDPNDCGKVIKILEE
jgi:lauroyl/myristoyl acyltransferase